MKKFLMAAAATAALMAGTASAYAEEEGSAADPGVPRSDVGVVVGHASEVSVPPNGSRLSCGRLACWRNSSGRQSVPARARHNGFL